MTIFVELDWKGPRLVDPDLLESISYSTEPGVYMWVVKVRREFMVNYVGRAKQGLKTRILMEWKDSTKGNTNIYDDRLLGNGIRKRIYTYDKRRDSREVFNTFRKDIEGNLSRWNVLFAPQHRDLIPYIENALIHHFKNHSEDDVSNYIDNERIEYRIRASEDLVVKNRLPCRIRGLTDYDKLFWPPNTSRY